LDRWRKFSNSKTSFSRSRNSNSSYSFWWGCWSAYTNATEEYDGSTWTTSPASLATAKRNLAGAGTQASLALSTGGSGDTNVTEEYTGPGPATKTITVS
jgi:hypothetical protein